MRLLGTMSFIGLFLLVMPVLTQENPAVEVQVVKYDGLKDLVLKNRGKVIVADFWHTL